MRLGLLLLALLTTQAIADSVVFTVASKHTQGKYNEFNPGIGFEKQLNERWTLAGGYYRNSNYQDSFYAGVIYSRFRLGDVRIGTSLGVVTGYGKPLPMVAPMLMWKDLNILIIPPLGGKTGLVGFQYKVPIR